MGSYYYGIMEKKMETTAVYWGYRSCRGYKGLGVLGLRVQGVGFRVIV